MTGPVTPAAIAWLARSHTTTLQEAADLIQHYAEAYASAQIIKALDEFHARQMALLEMPLVRVQA